MIIPEKLKIGGHIYEIDCSQELEGKNGETLGNGGDKIRICKTISQTQKEGTLIHEIFHVICSELAETNMGHCLQSSLAEQIYQVLKDNDLLK